MAYIYTGHFIWLIYQLSVVKQTYGIKIGQLKKNSSKLKKTFQRVLKIT